jgi:hypothetical protein
MGFTSLK